MDDDDLSVPAAGNRLAHFEDCRSAVDQLFFEALTTQGTQAFDEFLDFVIRFSNLSVYNAMLVRVQRPGAGAVATRNKWEEFGRLIKPDAIPIMILRPFGPVAFVFDQVDTYGDPLPGEEHNPLLAKGLLSQEMYKQTCMAAEKYGIEIEETDQYGTLLAGTAAGFKAVPDSCVLVEVDEKSGKEKPIRAFRIRLNAKHDLATRFATLAHELGHIYCGHVGAESRGRWPGRRQLSYEQREVEAEAVSWLVCERNGVKTKSREYLIDLIKRADFSGISMYAIFEAANRVESRTSPIRRK
jgi:hypothetical protein